MIVAEAPDPQVLEAARRGRRGRLPRARRAAPERAPRALLPHARLAAGRRGCAPGDASPRVARARRIPRRAQDASPRLARARRVQGGKPLRPWLYTIATNASLDVIAKRPKRLLRLDGSAPSRPRTDPGKPLTEVAWLEPYPDEHLALPDGRAAPDAPLRAAGERRARVRRRAPAPARPAARGADPPRGARLLRP